MYFFQKLGLSLVLPSSPIPPLTRDYMGTIIVVVVTITSYILLLDISAKSYFLRDFFSCPSFPSIPSTDRKLKTLQNKWHLD